MSRIIRTAENSSNHSEDCHSCEKVRICKEVDNFSNQSNKSSTTNEQETCLICLNFNRYASRKSLAQGKF